MTVQGSGTLPFESSDVAYYVGTGAPIQFSTQVTNHHCFRVRVTPFQLLDLDPRSPELAAGPVSLPDAIVGIPYSAQVSAALTGLPPYTMRVAGTPPDGVSVVVVSNGTAAASLQILSTGLNLVAEQRRQFTALVVDGLNTTNTRTYDLRVITPAPQITNNLIVLKAGESFIGTLGAINGTEPFTWTNLSGQMPFGFSLNASGTLSGTPSADDAERFETGRFTNIFQVADSLTDRLTGAPAPRIATNTVVELVRLSYSQNIWSPRTNGPSLNTICIFCHGSGFPPDVGSGNATLIIGVASQANGMCPGRIYVVPGSPSNSLIYQKLVGPGCGVRMPFDGPYFDDVKLGRMKRWIQELLPGDTD